MNNTLLNTLKAAREGLAERLDSMTLPAEIPHGDMPGDKVLITESHVAKAKTILPALVDKMIAALENKPLQRCVISVCGGSGVGKSETASLLGWYLGQLGAKSYILSGDNYPHRIPEYNDAERLRVFRDTGPEGSGGRRPAHRPGERAAAPADGGGQGRRPRPVRRIRLAERLSGRRPPWPEGLSGHPNEIDFDRVNSIIAQFQAGAERISLKRMGRRPSELWAETVDFSETSVLIIEWTHSNNDHLAGVDLPVLLNSTPAETMPSRRERNRDGKVDSPFTTMVLEIEQGLLAPQAHKAAVILSKSGELLSYAEYQALMAQRLSGARKEKGEPSNGKQNRTFRRRNAERLSGQHGRHAGRHRGPAGPGRDEGRLRRLLHPAQHLQHRSGPGLLGDRLQPERVLRRSGRSGRAAQIGH